MKTTLIINNINNLDKSIAHNSTLPLHNISNYTHKRILAHERLSNICTSVLVLLSILCGIYLLRDLILWRQGITAHSEQNDRTSLDLRRVREIVLASDADSSRVRNVQCRYWNCLSLYRCGQDHLKVYVYPLEEYEDESTGKLASTLTAEYYTILKTVVRSDYYTANPNEACLFLPSLDLLNEQLVVPQMASRALAQLPHWDEGKNHLIFNFLTRGPAHTLETATDSAIIVGGSFDIWTYRRGFDISLPIWSPHLASFDSSQIQHVKRKYTLIAAQLHVSATNLRTMQVIAQKHVQQVLLLQDCINEGKSDSSSSSSVDDAKQQQHEEQTTNKRNMRCSRNGGRHGGAYEYPSVLAKGTFCLMTRTTHNSGQADLLEILAHNCIPVVAINNYVLPFEDVIDWTLAAIRLNESDLHAILQRVNEVSSLRISEFQQQIRWLYENYFRNLSTITLTTLDILQDRIFPHRARSLRQWNTHATHSVYRAAQNPLFLPLVSSRAQGFTAVILTYDRVESLFTLIHKLAAVPSLQSILVIWNNQRKSPPHLSAFPAIMKPLKVIQTRANKLSNRFYPYAEIETEAILTIDDDINMLTADELDFGFEVWREFPDRIVGFPSRQHVWDNATQQWRYESEWTNEISMVLTGAAFHHKIWSHMYTYNMPPAIKQWVDEHMNCEDIAMNFLVANITNQPPIKVTPRKKFKCPQCTNTEMLSADLNHMRERSACIHRFAQQYGRMPLRSVEFRADPVLFRDNFPEKLKRFNDIGTL